MGKNDLAIIVVAGIAAVLAYFYLTQKQIIGVGEKLAGGVSEITGTPERWVKETADWLQDVQTQQAVAAERKIEKGLATALKSTRKIPLRGPVAYSFQKLATPGLLEKSIGEASVQPPAKWQKYQVMMQYGRMKVLQRKIALSSRR